MKKKGLKDVLAGKFLKIPVFVWLTVVLFAAGGGIAWLSSQPQHAGWRYGACRAFLELYVRFPDSIEIEEGGETRTSAIISYIDVNPFGSRQLRIFECNYTQEQGRIVLSRITLDRRALPTPIIDRFNNMLPVVTSLELNTALPKDIPDALEDLKD